MTDVFARLSQTSPEPSPQVAAVISEVEAEPMEAPVAEPAAPVEVRLRPSPPSPGGKAPWGRAGLENKVSRTCVT